MIRKGREGMKKALMIFAMFFVGIGIFTSSAVAEEKVVVNVIPIREEVAFDSNSIMTAMMYSGDAFMMVRADGQSLSIKEGMVCRMVVMNIDLNADHAKLRQDITDEILHTPTVDFYLKDGTRIAARGEMTSDGKGEIRVWKILREYNYPEKLPANTFFDLGSWSIAQIIREEVMCLKGNAVFFCKEEKEQQFKKTLNQCSEKKEVLGWYNFQPPGIKGGIRALGPR